MPATPRAAGPEGFEQGPTIFAERSGKWAVMGCGYTSDYTIWPPSFCGRPPVAAYRSVRNPGVYRVCGEHDSFAAGQPSTFLAWHN